jgi:hypothetical protein
MTALNVLTTGSLAVSACLIVLYQPLTVWAADLPFAEATALWQKSKDMPGYQRYLAEFTQWNNAFRLDEQDGCYEQLSRPIELALVISAEGLITQVATSSDDDGAACFRRTYDGQRVKPPPHAPFVIRMGMEPKKDA